jgi:rod shape-determining protein MreC
MTAMPLRRVLGTVMIFVAICAALILLDRRSALEPVRSGLNELVSPISEAFYDVVDNPDRKSELERQLAEVTEERDRLLSENAQLQAQTAELAQLQEAMRVEAQNPDLNLTPVDVIGRDPTGQQMFILINRGSNDGIRKGMAIVSPWYFVGQVVEVSENTSKVMLIIDASMSVGATLQDSRGGGIVTGQWQHGGYLSMLHVQPEQAPQEGDWVVTSDATETQTRQVPPNILIGKVAGEPVVDAQTNQLQIQIQPGISDFNELTVVFVAEIVDDGN